MLSTIVRPSEAHVLNDVAISSMQALAVDPHSALCPNPVCREAVVGRNCRFLQGPGTDPAEVQKLRDGLAAERPTTVRLLNYKHDGTPFWNHLHVSHVRDARGKVGQSASVQPPILSVSEADMGCSESLCTRYLEGGLKTLVLACFCLKLGFSGVKSMLGNRVAVSHLRLDARQHLA